VSGSGIPSTTGERFTRVRFSSTVRRLLLAAAGVGIGVMLALGLSRSLVSNMLFSTSPHDAATFVSVAALLGAVSLVASYIPARRATRVDPIVALRTQ
jgi:putative ABC transport system permease protein